jgi:hypothetical protein
MESWQVIADVDDSIMPNPKRPRDANQLAKMIVDLSTGDEQEPEMSPKQKAGQLGGLKGGKARAEKLSPAKRKAIAKKAAEARWKKS